MPPSAEEAARLTELDAAIAANPDDAQAYQDRGGLLRGLGRAADALEDYRRCAFLVPDDRKRRFNVGLALLDLHRPQEALTWIRQAADDLQPYLPAWTGVGEALLRMGEAQEAISWFDRVLALEPDNVQARLGRAVAQLSLGNFREGWLGFEVRLQDSRMGTWRPRPPPDGIARPPWRGDVDVRGRTLLVTAEQGLGDSIMMARYLPLLRAGGARVVLQLQRHLPPLMQGMADHIGLLGDVPPDYDMHVPMMSLPRAFQTVLETIPADVPYLHINPALLGVQPRPRIGLAWAGNPLHALDGLRSTSFTALLPLITRVDADFHVLHLPVAAEERAMIDRHRNVIMHPEDRDLLATAALIAAMDLVISVDTSIAHLAGALARPVWLMLPGGTTDFRWLRGRADSPWYPTMRIFRQPRLGDWAALMEDVLRAWEQGALGGMP